MSRVGKNTVASIATFMCIVFVLSIVLPFSGAQSADTTPPVTTATESGTVGDNGWYKSNNVTVTLTAVDDSSGVAHTYYRLDSGNIITYTSPFEVSDGNHTMIFYSDDNAGNVETIKTPDNYKTIKVDTRSPVMNMTIIGTFNTTTGSYIGVTRMNLTASDNGSDVSVIQYSIDGVWATYNGTNVSITDGQHTFEYGSIDRAGNINNSTPTTIKVFNPDIVTSPDCNYWYDHYLYGNAFILPSSVDHIEYTYNNVTWYSQPLFDLFGKEGKYEIWYRAIGKSGEISDTRYIWFGVDITPPTIGITKKGVQSGSGWFDSDITATIDARDNGSIKKTEWSFDQTHWTECVAGKPFTINKQGSKTIYFRTYDMFDRPAEGSDWLYFAPGSYTQGSMSNSVWIDGVLYGPSTGASPTETPGPTLTPTYVPSPTPTQAPSPTPATETTTGSNNLLALAVLIGVMAIVIVAAAAAYFFMLKPK